MTPNYKETLNLPRTDFPMKANLAAREPELLKMWQKARQLKREYSLGKRAWPRLREKARWLWKPTRFLEFRRVAGVTLGPIV
jgi:hypothetical protein